MASVSRLTVGKERLPAKPPRGAPPCQEPYLKGTNILKDPGVELQLANFGGGPGGNEIPMQNIDLSWGTGPVYWNGLPYQWNDGTPGPSHSYFSHVEQGVSPHWWRVFSTNPRTGTYHLRHRIEATGSSTILLLLPQINLCSAIPFEANTPDFATAVVSPGDFIRFSVYASASTLEAQPWAAPGLSFHNGETGSWVESFFTNTEMTAGYAQYEVSGFVPSGVKYVDATYYTWLWNTATVDCDVDVDDFALEVT